MVLMVNARFWAVMLMVTALLDGEEEGLSAADGEGDGAVVMDGDGLGVGGKFCGFTTNHTPFIP